VPAVGEHWGYREKARTLGQPLRPVEVLQLGPPRSRKVRVRWLDGEYEGLDQWVPGVRLVVPWEEAADLVRDEDQLLGLRALQPDPPGKAMADAVSTVWFATAEENVLFDVRDRRPLELTVVHVEDRDDAIEPLIDDLLGSPGAYVDSAGDLHVGQVAAIQVAVHLARRWPERVLAYAEREVERLRVAVRTGGTSLNFTTTVASMSTRTSVDSGWRRRKPPLPSSDSGAAPGPWTRTTRSATCEARSTDSADSSKTPRAG
jgi:hypothetical protein